MKRDFYLDLAASGHRMPIGTHLVLHEHEDAADILRDGLRLGGVVEMAARRFRTPLAVPLMDLTLEKAALLAACGVAPAEVDSYHFQEPPEGDVKVPLSPRMTATCEGIGYIAHQTSLVPVGMGIGPFSLATKLVADPITPVFLAGAGASSAEEPEVRLIERTLSQSLQAILGYLEAQLAAGARAIIICEPAANKVFFSPNQLARSFDVFDRFVLEPNRRIKELLTAHGADLIFHDCGELTEGMVRRIASLDPAIMSLGSSRKLWEDAALVPKSTVLYGNLPSKRFYSDALISREQVKRQADELVERMRSAGHAFILGSECDVLSVPGLEQTILEKVEAFLA
jgi:uroporphyrinogen-III decarboxylase